MPAAEEAGPSRADDTYHEYSCINGANCSAYSSSIQNNTSSIVVINACYLYPSKQ